MTPRPDYIVSDDAPHLLKRRLEEGCGSETK
jgi:hypothetical protein